MKKIRNIIIITALFLGLFIIGCSGIGGDGNNNNPDSGTNTDTDTNTNPDNNTDTDTDDTVKIQGKVIILQAYGNAGEGSPAGVSHSFIELYNITDEALKLDGNSLYYANGIRSTTETPDVTEDEPWKSIALTGTIPAKGSFLILGKKHDNLTSTRYKITDDSGDINDNNLSLNRRGFKIALIKGSAALTVQNPFNSADGKPVSGYIDMVGTLNNPDAELPDHIFGYEKAPARNSASEAVRRQDLIDTDDNSTDFIAARYASSGAGAFTNEMLEVRKPRNSGAGTWEPFAAPAPPVLSQNTLIILQVFGMHADNDSAPTHSFIELYNKSDAPIDLSTYSVHWANGLSDNATAPAEKDVWHKINLTGNIPAKSSYLILGKQVVTTFSGTIGRLDLTTVTADVNEQTFLMSNRSYKVALMSNNLDLTVANPWGDPACIDLVSAINDSSKNDSVTAAKGEDDLTAVNTATAGANTISKQKAYRRTGLDVTDVTLTDFTSKQYSTLTTDDIAKFRPRTTADGSYTPQF